MMLRENLKKPQVCLTKCSKKTFSFTGEMNLNARIINYNKSKKVLKWTRSYYVETAGSVSSETIKRYIEGQTNASKEDD